jgi:pumilio family protein 6
VSGLLSEAERKVDGSGHPAAREAHKAQKILLDQRKASKPHATLLRDAKRVWSLARQKNIGSERKKHITNLMGIVRGHVKDIVFKHDASRIVQTIVRWGGPSERNEIATELKGSFKELSESKYSKVCSSVCPNHHGVNQHCNSFW